VAAAVLPAMNADSFRFQREAMHQARALRHLHNGWVGDGIRQYFSLHIGLQGETMNTMKPIKPVQSGTASAWVRIPDGTKVKHRHEGHVGFIDGLTEIVSGPNRNPDGKTQYRMNIGAPDRQLVTESDLSILVDDEELVIMLRQKAPYRRAVTQSLHSVLAPDRFVKPS
jgi:hypothetical protein